jgi:hypothetical protein
MMDRSPVRLISVSAGEEGIVVDPEHPQRGIAPLLQAASGAQTAQILHIAGQWSG